MEVMGLFHMSSSVFDRPQLTQVDWMERPQRPNPNPTNWEINTYTEMGKYLIVDITYPDCTTFEGRKILVYKGCTMQQLLAQHIIDPHFSANKRLFSPIARFSPDGGWDNALFFVTALLKGIAV